VKIEPNSGFSPSGISLRFDLFGEEAAALVNVHIHQFQPGGAVVDAAALASFRNSGALTASWSKVVSWPTTKSGISFEQP
jgi:hypothetical protein